MSTSLLSVHVFPSYGDVHDPLVTVHSELVSTFLPSRFSTSSRVLHPLDRLHARYYDARTLCSMGSHVLALVNPVGEFVATVAVLRPLRRDGQVGQFTVGRRRRGNIGGRSRLENGSGGERVDNERQAQEGWEEDSNHDDPESRGWE